MLPPTLQAHPLTNWMRERGWNYHAHQLELLETTRAGHDALLLAPTGSGKTLAGFLPSLVDLHQSAKTHPKSSFHTLYLSALKALAADVQRNLLTPIEDLGLPIQVETRTGDTPTHQRSRQKAKPPQLLLTTPESLALLTSYPEAKRLFQHLRYVIVDELHTLINQKRGDLLALNLERLRHFAPRAQRIGLSATIAQPQQAKQFLCRKRKLKSGKSSSGQVIQLNTPALAQVEILSSQERIPWSGHLGSYAAPEIYRAICAHRLSLVFVNTRAQAELMFQKLWQLNEKNLRIALHHGSLDPSLRREVEAKMAVAELDCVVATASLDLGLDWAAVDLVIQVGAPKSTSRLLQRIGRANHRLDEPSKALLVPSNRFEYLECLAALEALHDQELDAAPAKQGALDVLCQHLLGIAVHAPFQPAKIYREVRRAQPYRQLSQETFQECLHFVQNGGYALKSYEKFAKLIPLEPNSPAPDPASKQNSEPLLQLREPKLASQYRMNLGTIVESPQLKVKLRMRTLGHIEEAFVSQLKVGDSFLFGAQILQFEGLSDQGVQVRKSKAKDAQIPSFVGGRLPLSSQLAKRVRRLLQSPRRQQQLPAQISDWLQLQAQQSRLPPAEGLLTESFQRGKGRNQRHYLMAYTFAGRNAQQTLGLLLLQHLQKLGHKPLGFVVTDYALAIWALDAFPEPESLFTPALLKAELDDWLNQTPLLKRSFREVALIAGLIERRHPGKQKTGKQVTFSSDLIYDVLQKYQPDHILLQATQADARHGLIDLQRLEAFLTQVKGKIHHQTLSKVSPLALPLLLEVSAQTVSKERLQELHLQELEAELLAEVGLE